MALTTDPSMLNAQSIAAPSEVEGVTLRGTTIAPATPLAPLWMWAAVGWSTTPKMSQHNVFGSDVGKMVAIALALGSPGPGTSLSPSSTESSSPFVLADSTMAGRSYAVDVT